MVIMTILSNTNMEDKKTASPFGMLLYKSLYIVEIIWPSWMHACMHKQYYVTEFTKPVLSPVTADLIFHHKH